MATIDGIALSDQGPFLLPIEAAFVEGNGGLSINAELSSSPRAAVSQAMAILADRMIPMRQFRDLDLNIVFHTAIPLVGESYMLALGLAILCGALQLRPPSGLVVTGALGPAGEVIPVENISKKRKGAVKLGCQDMMLPEPQIDPQNSQINQWPVRSLGEALSALEGMHI